MKYGVCFIFIIILTTTVHSDQVPLLTWEDLIPKELLSDDPFAGLNEEQRSAANWVVYMIENLPERNSESEEIYQMIDESLPELEQVGIDVYKIMEKRKILYTSVVKELNGRDVSIPGYLLPLEMSGAKVVEFLLVPYIGACIHAPPPPPNQIVHVTVTPKKGYKNKSLFDPVLVTGMITIESMVKNLYLVDGSSDISIGYKMEASHIKPYKK